MKLVNLIQRFGWLDKVILVICLFCGVYNLVLGGWFSVRWWLGVNQLVLFVAAFHLCWASVIIEDQQKIMNQMASIIIGLYMKSQKDLKDVENSTQ